MSNKTPLFICLCGVFNHSESWVENIMQCFLSQDYEGRAELYLIDDRPGYPSQQMRTLQGSSNDRGIYHITVPERFPFLMAKYDFGIDEADVPSWSDAYVSVWDDDDGYLPHFLSGHAEVLAEHPWSYPENVYSTYGGQFRKECACGRFWASSAYRLESLRAIGGYGSCREPVFDQQFLSRMRKQFGETVHGPEKISYVYNWELSGEDHTSGYMTGPGEGWYLATPPSAVSGNVLVPRYNERYLHLLDMCKVFMGQSQ